MRFSQTLQVALEAVRLNRMRSLLTVLGIMIGIASVILTVGLGLGAQKQVKDEIAALGSNLLIVSPGSTTSSSGVRGGFGTATTLTRADAEALTDSTVAPSISAVAPVASASESLAAGSTTWTSTVYAITPDWLTVRSRSLTSGRFITTSDLSQQNKVVVLGSDTAEELFSGQSPVGQSVTINGGSFTVIGVMASSGSTSTSSTSDDDMVLMPLTTASAAVGTSATTGGHHRHRRPHPGSGRIADPAPAASGRGLPEMDHHPGHHRLGHPDPHRLGQRRGPEERIGEFPGGWNGVERQGHGGPAGHRR